MVLPSSYVLDRESIKLKAYRLICHFYANKEIARQTDPVVRSGSLVKLEDSYFHREISKLMLELAISIRVLDDQMKKIDSESEIRIAYEKAMNNVNNRYQCMEFPEMGLPEPNLREICNKIIHADIIEPHFRVTEDGQHEIDNEEQVCYWAAREDYPDKDISEPSPIKWKYLNNSVRLGGKRRGKQWYNLLVIPTFVKAIGELFE